MRSKQLIRSNTDYLLSLLTLVVFLYGCNGSEFDTTKIDNSAASETSDLEQIRQERTVLGAPKTLIAEENRARMRSLDSNSKKALASGRSLAANKESHKDQTVRRKVDNYLIHYGQINRKFIRQTRNYDLVILDPVASNLTRDIVADIQRGRNKNSDTDDVIVLLRVVIGEDLRTVGLSDETLLSDARFVGNATGPRVDPRGPLPDGSSDLRKLARLGEPSPGGVGYASFYLDDISVNNDPSDIGDGLPDRNPETGAAYVNAGDPQWYRTVNQMLIDSQDGLVGLREALTDSAGRGLNADGVLLDGLDNAAPNFYSDDSSAIQTEFEWTARGFTRFVRKLKARYPNKLIAQKDGLFYFDPRLAHYRLNTRKEIDFLLFNSYRLNASSDETYNEFLFKRNKFDLTPKIMAEAGRVNGFQVLSLGYAEGPGIEYDTLFNRSSLGYEILLSDIDEAEQVGYRHYLTNKEITLNNNFVRKNRKKQDRSAPKWSSTFSAAPSTYPALASEPEPRVGIQRITQTDQGVRVHWDVALDKSEVLYHLYVQENPFNFNQRRPVKNAKKYQLFPNRGAGYGRRDSESTYAYSDIISGLESGKRYHFLIRAEDSFGNEEKNEEMLTVKVKPRFLIDGSFDEWESVDVALTDADEGTPSAGPDYSEIKYHVRKDKLFLYVKTHNRYNLDGSPDYQFSRSLIFIDVDNNINTGFPISGSIGSDLVINGDHIFKQSSTSFNDGLVGTLSAAGVIESDETEYVLPLSLLRDTYADVSDIQLVFVNDEIGDYAPEWGQSLEIRVAEPDEEDDSEVVIDGLFSEWDHYPILIADENDAADSAGPDWLDIKAACDADNLHLYITSDNTFNLDGSPTYAFSRSLIYFDTDEDDTTGYSFNGIGSDYVLNGGNLFAQTSTQFNAGFIGSAFISNPFDVNAIEMTIPYSLLNIDSSTEWIRLQFLNDETYDLAPEVDYILRLNLTSCSGVVVEREIVQPMSIDGDFSDWDQIPLLYGDQDDVPDSAGPNWLDIKMTDDENNLYFYVTSKNTYNLDGSPEFSFSRQLIFIDIDNDPSTGWALNGIGSDVVINGAGIFGQTSTNFASTFIGTMQVSGLTDLTQLEMAFDRSTFLPDGEMSGTIKVLFLNDHVFDYAPELGSTLDYDL